MKRKRGLRGRNLPGIAGRDFDRRSIWESGIPWAVGFVALLPVAGEASYASEDPVFAYEKPSGGRGRSVTFGNEARAHSRLGQQRILLSKCQAEVES